MHDSVLANAQLPLWQKESTSLYLLVVRIKCEFISRTTCCRRWDVESLPFPPCSLVNGNDTSSVQLDLGHSRPLVERILLCAACISLLGPPEWNTSGCGLNNRNLFPPVLKVASPRSRCLQVWFLLRPLSPWFTEGRLLTVSSHGLSSMCPPLVSLCAQISSSYKDTSQIGLGPTLMASY